MLYIFSQQIGPLELVSKRWRNLIRCRYFMESNLVHQKSKHRFKILANLKDPFARKISTQLLLFHSSDDDSGFSYLLRQSAELPSLSCDGIICCLRPGISFLFINPATGQRLQLNRPPYNYFHLQKGVTLPLLTSLSTDK